MLYNLGPPSGTLRGELWPYRKLYSIPAGCYHRFIDLSDFNGFPGIWYHNALQPGTTLGGELLPL